MKTNYIKLIIAILISISFPSCENDFNVDMEKEHVVLHALAFEGESPKIILARTLEAFPKYPFNLEYYSQPFYSDNVEIIVSSANETYTNFEIHQIPIKISEYDNPCLSTEITYFSDENFIPEPGKEYTIEVYEHETHPVDKRSGFSLKSTTKIPNRIPLILEQVSDEIDNEFLQFGYEDTLWNQVYNISFDDPANEENYYYLTLSNVVSNYDFSIDTVDMDKLWNGYISYDSQDYWLENLKNSYSELKGLPGNETEESYSFELQGFLFNDINFDGQTKNIEVQINNYLYSNDFKYFVVELFHISKEYYNYYSTVQTQGKTQQDIFTEPTQIYSNIDGGLGVFAGATLTTSSIKVVSMP